MSVVAPLLRSRALDALTSPHGVDRYFEMVNPMWAAHEVRARIVDIHREVDVPGTPPVATLTLQPTSTWRGHRAGQYVQLGVEVDGARRTTRCFSVSSPDSSPGDALHDHHARQPGRGGLALPGRAGRGRHDRPPVPGATGSSPCRTGCPTTSCFISGGSGHHAAMSMLRSLLQRTHRGRITFLHYAQSPDHQIFRDELDELRGAGYGIDLHLVYPEAVGPGAERLNGGVSRRWSYSGSSPDFQNVDTWACGPAGLIEKVQAGVRGSESCAWSTSRPPR